MKEKQKKPLHKEFQSFVATLFRWKYLGSIIFAFQRPDEPQ